MGVQSGQTAQGTQSVAIGFQAGTSTQGQNSIAIGYQCGNTAQGSSSIAIGYLAGNISQGTQSIAIGYQAGQTQQPNNSIVLNAATAGLSGATQSAFYVAPVRQVTAASIIGTGYYLMYYNPTTKEIICTDTQA